LTMNNVPYHDEVFWPGLGSFTPCSWLVQCVPNERTLC
jgi:hypothetical protein